MSQLAARSRRNNASTLRPRAARAGDGGRTTAAASPREGGQELWTSPALRVKQRSWMLPKCCSNPSWKARTFDRNDAKSSAFTVAPGRNLQMHSSISSNPSVVSFLSLPGANSNWTYIPKCFSLTSNSFRALIASSFCVISKNSCFEISPLPSLSVVSNSLLMDCFTLVSVNAFFSDSAVFPTTSTRMPVSILSIVKELSRT
mmetsp:Transcript_50448/g.141824  ORF Transcript_50448/g.141824 Transcript_50448/m.141824 type:complete len:202 (+) Transcript_50448:181-786(+)